MLLVIVFCVAFRLTTAFVRAPLVSNYNVEREKLMAQEQHISIGGQIVLTPDERKVDNYLRKLKKLEIENGLENPDTFAPGLHFFRAKPLMEQSLVFRLLQKMPKGAMLHGHDTAMISVEWIVSNLTYHSDALKCIQDNGQTLLTFLTAQDHNCASDYVRVVDERSAAQNKNQYDASLIRNLSMLTENPENDFPDGNSAWRRFQKIFSAIGGILNNERTFVISKTKLLQELYDDNIMYAEIRSSLSPFPTIDGHLLTTQDVIRLWRQIIQDFRFKNPSFQGVKFILAHSRNTQFLDDFLKSYRCMKHEFPDLIVGFDLVGQEDIGRPLVELADDILHNPDIDFFFHAGETGWHGYSSDLNLFDAVLMNTSRIGHAFSLYRHPVLMQIIKQHHICLEVCPISNQVLRLVEDLRNHPGGVYSAINMPMVIASDDPAFWGATGVSYDLYYALMCFTSADVGLSYVKQLAISSLQCSRLTASERNSFGNVFNMKWKQFIQQIIREEGL